MSRVRLDRTHLVASFGINWRTVAEAVGGIEAARDAGFRWVEFAFWDREYLGKLRGSELQEHYAHLLALPGWLHHCAATAKRIGIGFAAVALSKYVVEEAALVAGMVRVPLECAEETGYWVRLSQVRAAPLVVYETTATWPTPTTGRVPIFIAPGWPSAPCDYDPYFSVLSPAHRLGVAFHGAHGKLFQAAALAAAPVVIQPVVPDGTKGLPDRAIAIAVSSCKEWIEELHDADAALDGQPPRQPPPVQS